MKMATRLPRSKPSEDRCAVCRPRRRVRQPLASRSRGEFEEREDVHVSLVGSGSLPRAATPQLLTTRLRRTPMRSFSSSITSPGLMKRKCSRPQPLPTVREPRKIQGLGARDARNQVLEYPIHRARVCAPPFLAGYARDHRQVVRVRNFVRGDEAAAHRVCGVEVLALRRPDAPLHFDVLRSFCASHLVLPSALTRPAFLCPPKGAVPCRSLWVRQDMGKTQPVRFSGSDGA
jgi:hypothetical protein